MYLYYTIKKCIHIFVLVTGDVSQGSIHSVAQRVDDKEYSLDAGLTRYITEKLTMDYSGCYVGEYHAPFILKTPFEKILSFFFLFCTAYVYRYLYSN
jgi:hypothetical protein